MNDFMNQVIYADNAATTRLDKQVFAEMQPWLESEFGNASQPYSFARNPKKAVKEARTSIAECIGALPEEILFTSGGTESDNWALKATATREGKQGIVTSSIEHHAVLNSCEWLRQNGCPVHYADVDRNGLVPLITLDKIIDADTNLVSIMFANNEIGTIEPIAEIALLAHDRGALFHTDAVQAVGHVPIDVKAMGIDLLSASAHKFNGPKGIGFLYVRKGVTIHPLIHGGSQENGLRAGTENVAGIVGMAKALEINCHEMEKTTQKLQILENTLLQALNNEGIDYIRNGADNRLPGNVNISIRNSNGEMLLHRLDLMGIMISTGSACDSKNTQVSHVIEAIKVPKEYAEGTIRVSFGRHNTKEDAVAIAKAIAKVIKT